MNPRQVFLIILSALCWLLTTSCSSWGSRDREEAELRLQIGTSYLVNGQYPQALNELLIAEKLDASNPVIHNNLALTYFMRQRYDLAEKHAQKALRLDSKYSDARNNLSRIYVELGKFTEAIEESQKVSEDLTYPYPEKPLINIGIAQFKLNQFSQAEKNLVKAIDLQRDNCLAHVYLGRTYFEQKDYAKSAPTLDRAVEFCDKDQSFDEPLYFSGLSHYQLGQRSVAEVRLEQLLKLYPHGPYANRAKQVLEVIRK